MVGFSKKFGTSNQPQLVEKRAGEGMFFTLESPYPYFCCNLRRMGMPYMYSEMQNKLSKTRDSPLESMGQIISSRCPILNAIFRFIQTLCLCTKALQC